MGSSTVDHISCAAKTASLPTASECGCFCFSSRRRASAAASNKARTATAAPVQAVTADLQTAEGETVKADASYPASPPAPDDAKSSSQTCTARASKINDLLQRDGVEKPPLAEAKARLRGFVAAAAASTTKAVNSQQHLATAAVPA